MILGWFTDQNQSYFSLKISSSKKGQKICNKIKEAQKNQKDKYQVQRIVIIFSKLYSLTICNF